MSEIIPASDNGAITERDLFDAYGVLWQASQDGDLALMEQAFAVIVTASIESNAQVVGLLTIVNELSAALAKAEDENDRNVAKLRNERARLCDEMTTGLMQWSGMPRQVVVAVVDRIANLGMDHDYLPAVDQFMDSVLEEMTG